MSTVAIHIIVRLSMAESYATFAHRRTYKDLTKSINGLGEQRHICPIGAVIHRCRSSSKWTFRARSLPAQTSQRDIPFIVVYIFDCSCLENVFLLLFLLATI